MPVNEYSEVPDSNATVGGIDIAEGCAPGNINNAIRQVMADIAEGVVHAYPQTLDPTKQAAARVNIGADKTVNYTAQTLTAPQQAQARDNIGAADSATAVVNSRTVTAGTGLTGGGDLTADRTLAADFATQAEALAGVAMDKVMSPDLVQKAVAAQSVGVRHRPFSYTTTQRAHSTTYQNTSGHLMFVIISSVLSTSNSIMRDIQVSEDGSNWLSVSRTGQNTVFRDSAAFLVPNDWYYRINGATLTDYLWVEYRYV